MELLEKTLNSIGKPDTTAMEEARKRLDSLLKPQGSLGKLETIAEKIAGMTGSVKNSVDKKTILIMAGDNGVFEEKTSSFPQEVSFLVADTMQKGISGVAVLARHAGADLKVVDLGLNTDIMIPGIISRRIRKGTSNIARGPAMSREEAVKAIETGIETANQAIDEGALLLGTGEVGICNTTTSSAVLHALTGKDLDILTGRGAGLDDQGLSRKKEIIRKACQINNPDPEDAVDVIAKVGGFDIAGLTGCYLAAAARRVPIVIDGFISSVAAVAAQKLNPGVTAFMLPSHGTEEPGGKVAGELLGIEPMLDMNMRLGEGTGCALAFHIIDAAMAMMNDMGTFADVGM